MEHKTRVANGRTDGEDDSVVCGEIAVNGEMALCYDRTKADRTAKNEGWSRPGLTDRLKGSCYNSGNLTQARVRERVREAIESMDAESGRRCGLSG